jgi:hypothetical protein
MKSTATKERNTEDEGGIFKKSWKRNISFHKFTTTSCRICKKTVGVCKDYNVKQCCESHHKEKQDKFTEKCRTDTLL